MNAPLASDEFSDRFLVCPRFREAGDVTLDRFHHDGRVDDRWLNLQPGEFALLWRLAARPAERLSENQLRSEAWPVAHDPEIDGIATHVAGLRAKLEPSGLAQLIGTDCDGRYFLDLPQIGSFLPGAAC